MFFRTHCSEMACLTKVASEKAEAIGQQVPSSTLPPVLTPAELALLTLDDDLRLAFEASWKHDKAGHFYLASR
jgi:hypothetical protein